MSSPAPRFGAVAALVGASLIGLLLPGCGSDGGERAALQAYELQIEPLIAEDGTVTARLEDLRAELLAANAGAEEFVPFARDRALPFYARFDEKLRTVRPTMEFLRPVHESLATYVEARREYLSVGVTLFESFANPDLVEYASAQQGLEATMEALRREAAGSMADLEVAQALGLVLQFEQRMGLFRTGQVPVDALRTECSETVLPALRRLTARTGADLEAAGIRGSVARWCAAAQRYQEATLRTLAVQERLRAGNVVAEESWKKAGEARARFLDTLRKLHDRLR